MGADIHVYIEYRRNEDSLWHSLPRINPGRCYAIFEAFAGVRGDPDEAVVPPRGRLSFSTTSSTVQWDDWMSISYVDIIGDADEAASRLLYDQASEMEQGARLLEQAGLADAAKVLRYGKYRFSTDAGRAAVWVKTEGCEYAGKYAPRSLWDSVTARFVTPPEDLAHVGKPAFVTSPDHHSHTWLTPDEFEAGLRKADAFDREPEYRMLLASMRELEKMAIEVRAVMWWDN